MSSIRSLLDKFEADLRESIREEVRAELLSELRANMAAPQGRRWIDQAAIADKLGCSVRQVHRYRTENDFPRPRSKLGGGPAWFEDEIDAWMSDRSQLRY